VRTRQLLRPHSKIRDGPGVTSETKLKVEVQVMGIATEKNKVINIQGQERKVIAG
jgi:hypothetical protein